MCVVFSLDKENMETVEAKEHHQKIHEEEPLEKEMSKSVDDKSNVSDKILILQEGWLSITMQYYTLLI